MFAYVVPPSCQLVASRNPKLPFAPALSQNASLSPRILGHVGLRLSPFIVCATCCERTPDGAHEVQATRLAMAAEVGPIELHLDANFLSRDTASKRAFMTCDVRAAFAAPESEKKEKHDFIVACVWISLSRTQKRLDPCAKKMSSVECELVLCG